MPLKRSAAGSKRSAAAAAILQSGRLDFRCRADDAWYTVRLRWEGKETLRVMHFDFSEVSDEWFEPGQFETLEAVEEFKGRFRPESVQLQDCDCRRVVEGMLVCASHDFGEKDRRFYNAVVEAVHFSEHSLEGKKLCSCTYVVMWQEGPLAWNRESVSIENICLVHREDCEVDPILSDFVHLARKNIEERNSQVIHQPESYDLDHSNARVAAGSGIGLGSLGGSRSIKSHVSPCKLGEMTPSKRIISLEQDVDLGSSRKRSSHPTKKYYFIRIQNLERDTTVFSVTSFIHEHTSLTFKAAICPPLSSELFASGTIFIETKEKADKLSDFLFNPGHIIMSWRGRPWVLSEKWCGSVEGVMPECERQPSNKNVHHPSKIKLVYMGSKEFELCERLIKLHMEFQEHLQLINQRLAKEEAKLGLLG